MNRMLKVTVLGLLTTVASLSGFAEGAQGNSADNRAKRSGYAAAKVVGLTSGAYEIGVWDGSDSAKGIAIQVDHFYVVGGGIIGPFVRRYHGNNFFAQLTVGYAQTWGMDVDLASGAGAHLLIGNEWTLDSGFLISADWIGVSAGVTAGKGQKARGYVLPSLPKLGIGFSL